MSKSMSRREVIAWLAASTGVATAGAAVAFNLSGEAGKTSAFSAGSVLSPGTTAVPLNGTTGSRLLVVLEMPGGNDGLSTVVPYGNAAYYDLRSETAIAQSEVLRIDDEIGLHPNLSKLHARGVTVVEGIGSMEPNGSHFEMLARWWAGDSRRADSSTGWIGRLADVLDDGSSPAMAVSISTGAHPIVRSAKGSALSLSSAEAAFTIAGAEPGDVGLVAFQDALRGFAAGSDGDEATAWMRSNMSDTIDLATRFVVDAEQGDAESRRDQMGYVGSGLSNSLEFAANVLGGTSGIRIVHVSMDGDFDTHDGHARKHPDLMQDLDDSLSAFHNDIEDRGLQDQVMVMTTSEFGRTPHENGSGGLDHGAASVALLSGPGTGGRRGDAESLTDRDTNDDLKATAPFEMYLGGVVEGWLGVPAAEIFGSNDVLPLF